MSEPDDLLTALRAARPDPGYQPSPASPQALALLTRIVADDPEGSRRLRRIPRRLVLAGVPALAGAAAAGAVIATRTRTSGPFPQAALPSVPSVRTAVLDAFERSSGDILATAMTGPWIKGTTLTERNWFYPLLPQPGDRVRFRTAISSGGSLVTDQELAYTLPGSGSNPPLNSTTFYVDYKSRTWYRTASNGFTVTVGVGSFSPGQIRDRIASGSFRIAGTGQLNGRRVIKLALPGRAGFFPGAATILWVDARTYATLRVDSTVTNPNGVVQHFTTTYQLLPATERNLALLTPPVPAGFTRTPKPVTPFTKPHPPAPTPSP